MGLSSALRLAQFTGCGGEQILEIEVGGACSMHGGEEKFIHGRGGVGGNLNEWTA